MTRVVSAILLALLLFALTGIVEARGISSSSTVTVLDTPRISVPLVINENGLQSYGLSFGVHPDATAGIDPALGETEYPPFPPGGGMAMLHTPGGNAILDLRPYTGLAQIDTYKVGMVFSDSLELSYFPIQITWPYLGSTYGGSVRMTCANPLFDIDMKAQNSFTIETADLSLGGVFVYISIIAEAPLPGTTLPVASTYGWGNGGLQGIIHAPDAGPSTQIAKGTAAGTSSWFEYGPNKSYGSSTTPVLVADGASARVSSPFSPSSLPPDSRLHFRTVAEHNGVLYYGGDRMISNGYPPPEVAEDTTRYRTATYLDWSDAKDGKGKRKALKGKPVGVAMTLNLVVPADNLVTLRVTFRVTGNVLTGIWTGGNGSPDTLCHGSASAADSKLKQWTIDLHCPATDSIPHAGDTLVLKFNGAGGKLRTSVAYSWEAGAGGAVFPGTWPKAPLMYGDTLKQYLVLPMPNLVNVGEGIYGGTKQTPVNITIGTSPTVTGGVMIYHPKYKDVQKTLIKERRGGDLYDTAYAHCIRTFDKSGKPITKMQKSLPPDKHNNRLVGEQLALKLNVVASDSGIFPPGFGDLIYDNSLAVASPFDGLSVRAIIDSVDCLLGCQDGVAGISDFSRFVWVDSLLNAAFAAPIDTESWSGGKIVCTGARSISEVPYLHANPSPPATLRQVFSPVFSWAVPSGFSLLQNYPNPFNPSTTIAFSLAEDALVTVKVYNTLGQEVTTVVEGEEFTEGENDVEFDGAGLSSGVYFYTLTAVDSETGRRWFSDTRKMIICK